MIAPLIVGLCSIGILISMGKYSDRPFRLAISFIPIFLFLALRYDYGNDYNTYLTIFEEIKATGSDDYYSEFLPSEIGWLYLNSVFGIVGFFTLVAFLAFTNCYIFARFVRIYCPPDYYWVAIFVYVFSPDNMLIQLSAMRQAVAISCLLLAIDFVIERKLIRFLFCIGFGMLFHSSALALFPIYFLNTFNYSIKKSQTYIYILFYVGLFFTSDAIYRLIPYLGLSNIKAFENYLLYYEDLGSVGTGAGLFLNGMYLATLIYFHDNQPRPGRLIFKLVMIGIFLIPLSIPLYLA